MSKNSIKFDGQKIKRDDFYKNRKIFNMNDIDANKILISKKEKYGNYDSFQHFIGYNDNNVIKPLYLELPQMTGYINKFNENKNKNTITMFFKVKYVFLNMKSFLKITIKYGKKLRN